MNKKAQAATEFLMTYGWAILVVGVAIAALAYFGVLSPTKFLPSKCTFPSGIACIDHKVSTSEITMILQNSLGYTITVDSINLTDASGCEATPGTTMQNGQQATFTVNCSNSPGEKFKSDMNLVFTRLDTNLSQQWSGEMLASVQ
ncbi:hypothetical protein KY311_02845 [Candidatus Woesearchaeota archaeon]|nr:hypothetical protein [Candidatus Woesearchaeota archaeon]